METCQSANTLTDGTIGDLAEKYSDFGGVFVWVGNDANVLPWSKIMYGLMNDTLRKNDWHCL